MTYEEFFNEWRGDSPFIIAHTSGSTGKPKEIRLDKNFVGESASRTNSFFNITTSSRLHSCVSPDFIGGKMMAVRAELAACTLTYETPSNNCLAGIGSREVIDLLAVVPSQMLHIVEHLDSMPQLNNIIVGGSAIHDSLRSKIIASGLNAYETYGMTETSSHIALRKIDGKEEWFTLFPGISVSLDERGCLEIKFSDNTVVVTNDLAELADAQHFKINGRADHVIVTGGKKVNPAEVESILSRVIDMPFVVGSTPDEKWGERVVLKIEGQKNQVLEESVKSYFEKKLTPWQRPKKIEWVERLPRTANGKLKR